MMEEEMKEIAAIIHSVIDSPEDESAVSESKQKALALCSRFPLPY
jgi:glycine/serine hydroxymethyltransferase